MNANTLFKAILLTFRLIPFRMVCSMGDGIGYILYNILKGRSAIGLSNLSLAFPEKTERERKEILKTFWKNFCKDLLEVVKYYASPSEIMGERVTLVNRENLDDLMAQKKGVIILSAHLGNFPLLCFKLGIEGYPIAVIYSEMHNRFFNPIIPLMQMSMGIEPISDKQRHACVRKSLSWLKKGGILFIQIDQSPPTEAGIPVSLFGLKVPTSRGPISLAMRTGANVLPVFIVRGGNNHHRIIIEKPYNLKLEGEINHDIRNNLEALSKITENYVRQYPTLWWWIHQRFRKAIKE